jgi:hypothetical protein
MQSAELGNFSQIAKWPVFGVFRGENLSEQWGVNPKVILSIGAYIDGQDRTLFVATNVLHENGVYITACQCVSNEHVGPS